jgi:hypothetical protein
MMVLPGNTTGFLVSICLLSIAIVAGAAAQESTGADSASAPAAEDDSWQDKSERQLRRELRDAEEAFFDAFNEVNSSDDLDVICRTSAPLGSRKRERKCQARFLWDHEEEIAENYARRNGGAGGPNAAPTSALQPRIDALRSEMARAMAEVPEVAAAFAALTQAKQNYERKMQQE